MESIIIECEGNKIIFEGELDPEILTTNLHPGFHVSNEETYKTADLVKGYQEPPAFRRRR